MSGYAPFSKDTDCYTCIGCSRCEDVTFRGRKNCPIYRPSEAGKVDDEIVYKYEQGRIKAVRDNETD